MAVPRQIRQTPPSHQARRRGAVERLLVPAIVYEFQVVLSDKGFFFLKKKPKKKTLKFSTSFGGYAHVLAG